MATSRQVNLALEVLVAVSVVTGVVSWMVPLGWARPITILHALSGLSILVVAPVKVRGPVRTGLRRRRATRWVSILLGVLVVATIGLGLAHSTGLWFGVGEWSALWTHLLGGFVIVPLLIWHVWTRPVRPSHHDLNRRAVLAAGVTVAAGGAALVAQEGIVAALGLAGSRRAGTGSHEIASGDPDRMPVVSWIDDRAPDLDPDRWPLRIDGRPVDVAEIAARAGPVVAMLDCTGGWRSEQTWDAVPLSALLGDVDGRSVRVTSATGYRRLFAVDALDDVYLATGYGGRALRRGHGAPVRLIAPGRRGPWWVKWVTDVEVTDLPSWAQLPFPAT